MRASRLLAPTLREVPAEAEVISHKLLLRAGLIRKLAGGVYTYLPLAQRVLKKITRIVREEMDRAGGQEVLLPIIQPAELWLETGRWDVYGKELFRLKDRHDRDFCLGPTHEEVITDLVRGEVRSYKQLPLILYQIQNKYRDERRPRFGLMRGREFIMKDMYSFDRDEQALAKTYQTMFAAYQRVFSRCGLQFRPVEADPGAIGGSNTHEFMVLAESGEAAVVYCNQCDYAANVEKAEARPEISPGEAVAAMAEVHTPDRRTIQEVAEFLDVPPQKLIKTLVYLADQQPVAVLIRGDREINEIKLANLLGCLELTLADARQVALACGGETGFVGPVGLQGIPVYADLEVQHLSNAVAGANKKDYHLCNINPERDFQVDRYVDLRMVEAGEACPQCGAPLVAARGIEVGQVFKLGTKYSKAMGAKYLDEYGQEQLIIMGCYGIGVSRTMAAAVEQNYDENGIKWPVAIAPYQVVVVPVNMKDQQMAVLAEEIYQELLGQGLEVILDDRPERPGVKFKDADLIGYPVRVTIGNKAVNEDKVEVRLRANGEQLDLSRAEVVEWIARHITTATRV